MKTQESQWYSFCPTPKTWESGKLICNFQSESESKEEKNNITTEDTLKQTFWSRKKKSFLVQPFYFIQVLKKLQRPIHIGYGNLLYSVYWFKCWAHLGPMSQTHTKIVCNQISGHPGAQLIWYIKTNITITFLWFSGKAWSKWDLKDFDHRCWNQSQPMLCLPLKSCHGCPSYWCEHQLSCHSLPKFTYHILFTLLTLVLLLLPWLIHFNCFSYLLPWWNIGRWTGVRS